MRLDVWETYKDKIFTFQSGSIQIVTVSFNILFAQFFTFQSGSIQISVKQMFEFDKISFTFQSGSIQINQEKGINIENELYIPIWFYSNLTGITEIDNDITTLHSNLVLFK